MNTTLRIWLAVLLAAVTGAAEVPNGPESTPAALVNLVLVQLDTSPEAVAAREFEVSDWSFWDRAAPGLLARLEGDLGRTRAAGPANAGASLYAVRCAAVDLDDTQNLRPLVDCLDGISRLTGRAGLLLVWMSREGDVLLGLLPAAPQEAALTVAALARIQPARGPRWLAPAVSPAVPPCVLAMDRVGATPTARHLGLDPLLRDGGLDSLSHGIALGDLQVATLLALDGPEAELAPGAEIRIETLQKNVDRFNDIAKTLYKVADIPMPAEMQLPLAFAAPVMGDMRSAAEGKLHPLTSQSLERVGKFGLSEMPKVVAALEIQGRLPAGYLGRLTPFLAGAPDIVAGAASQAGRGAAVPTVAEVTRYLDGVNKACWATVGALAAAPSGPAGSARAASIASTSAGLAGDIVRGWSYGAFEQAALDPVKRQMVSDFRTHLEAASGHGVQAKTFSEMFTPLEVGRLGFSSKTVAELDAAASWVNTARALSIDAGSVPPVDATGRGGDVMGGSNIPALPGDLIVRHGRNLLGPPLVTVFSAGRIDDIPHVGVVVDPKRFGFSAVDLELQQVGDKTHGVIKPISWNDTKQFQNAGFFSVMEANIPVKYQGNTTTFRDLPYTVKAEVRQQVQDRLAGDARSGRDVGEYKVASPGQSAQCFDYPLAVYDDVLQKNGVQVLRYEGPSAFLNWQRDKPVTVSDKSLTGGTLRDWFVVGEPLATVVHGDRTATWTDPSKINDKLPRVGAPVLSESLQSKPSIPTYWTESGRAQSATEAGVLPAMVNGRERAVVVGTGTEVDILYRGTVNRLGQQNVLRIDTPFYGRDPALDQRAKDFRADAILAVKQPTRVLELRVADLNIERPRPPEVASLRKPRDNDPPLFPPPGGGGPPGWGGPPPPGGGGGSRIARFEPPSGGSGGLAGGSVPERMQIARVDPVAFRSDYADRATRALAAPDLVTFKSVPAMPKPGGILFHPDLEITADESGMTATKAEAAVAAVKGRAGGEFRHEGQTYIAAKAPGSAGLFQVTAGRFRLTQQDLCLCSSNGLDVSLTRYYDSASTQDCGLGKGWALQPYTLRLSPKSRTDRTSNSFARRVVFVDSGTGAEMAYQTAVSEEARQPAPGVSSMPEYRPITSSFQPLLAAGTNGGYTVTFAHGLSVGFSPDGTLESVRTLGRGQIDYSYEAGRLTKVAGPAGVITVGYDSSGRLELASTSDGKRVAYVTRGSAAGIAEARGGVDGSFAFAYSGEGRIATVHELPEDSGPVLIARNTYDSKGRMLTQEGPGGIWRFRYDDRVGLAVFTDPSGKEVSYYYDGKQQLLAYGGDRKEMTLFNYDANGRVFQMAAGELLNEPSGGERPRFKVTRMITPEAPTPEKPAGSG